ncbi:flagellar assembly protein FliW [Clostridiaceae bacterium M8S5]|nr:flagellar assembly protein FliW [Clostridiaceae bacterium M8S5]
MKIQTKFFGEMDIKEEDVIHFPKGLIGFEDKKEFVIINPEEGTPFQYLQSIEDTELSFVIMNPFIYKKDYDFNIPKKVDDLLEIHSINDIEVYNIIVIPNDVSKMTANLAAPLIININSKLAKQIIIENRNYPVKFYVVEALKEAKQEAK